MVQKLSVPPVINIGGGALAETASVVRALGACRPLIVTDGFLANNGVAQSLVDLLLAEDLDVALYSGTVPDPTTDSVESGLELLNEHKGDLVIGLGGGSPIDTAKAISVLAIRGGSIRDLKSPARYDGPALPLIAIPTTAGTGSEATQTTVITDRESDEKMLCIGPSFLPRAAIVDYELTLSMPKRLSADTGLDALTHAVEAYVSAKSNSFSDALALNAIGSIGKHLRRVYLDGSDRVGRSAMMEAATLAGIAFSNSSVALVHAMSRPIGANFQVAHGMANAMLFATVTEFSLNSSITRYADCARALGAADRDSSDESAASALVQELHQLSKELAVPTPKSFGIDEASWNEAVPLMAKQAIASGSHLNNPKVPEASDIERLYRAVFDS